MIQVYKGQFAYQKLFVQLSAPENIGVYYMGLTDGNGIFRVLYVGKSASQDVGIRARLLAHFGANEWQGITHFGYCICDTQIEADNFEVSEIVRLQPKYNRKLG